MKELIHHASVKDGSFILNCSEEEFDCDKHIQTSRFENVTCEKCIASESFQDDFLQMRLMVFEELKKQNLL